jgi:hypothetical protein
MKKSKKIAVLIFTGLLVLVTTLAITQIVKLKTIQKNSLTNNEKVEESRDDEQERPTNDDPYKEISGLVKAYDLTKGVFYKGSVKLIDGNTEEDKVLEQQKFEYTVLGNEYEYSLDNISSIVKDSFVLFADHGQKSISILPLKGLKNDNKPFDISGIKKIIDARQANVAVTEIGNEKILTIDSIQGQQIQGYKIYYSPVTYRISKVLIGVHTLSSLETGEQENVAEEENENTDKEEESEINEEEDGFFYYLEVNYESIQQLSLTQEIFKPENKFIEKVSGAVALKEKYKEYEFINRVEPLKNKDAAQPLYDEE